MTQLLRDFVERVQGLVATHRAAGRRGGPLLDFISANFLYILTTVAVAGGAYATYERGSYSRDLRAIVTGIVTYGTHGKLRNMTLEDLDMVIPTGLEVDAATGVTYFGGILGDGLPLRIYGGTSTHAALGAGSSRQLVLVIGDGNTPANDSSGICTDLTRTLGPGVRTVQLTDGDTTPTATSTGTATIVSAAVVADVMDATGANAGTDASANLTFTRNPRAATLPLNEIHENDNVVDVCEADAAVQIVMVVG